MKKSFKKVLSFSILTLVLLVSTAALCFALYFVKPTFGGLHKNFLNFFLDVFKGKFVFAPFALATYIAPCVILLWILIWFILGLCKKRFISFAYLLGGILLAGILAFDLYLFANDKYFFTFIKDIKTNLVGFILVIVLSVFAIATLAFSIVLCVQHLRFAYAKEPVAQIEEKPAEEVSVAEEEKPEPVVETVNEEIDAPAEVEPVVEEKPVQKVEPRKRVVLIKKVELKQVKPAPKKVAPVAKAKVVAQPKKEPVVAPKPVAKPAPAKVEEKPGSGKVYHVSQHPSTNKWQVKLAKGEKALKLFNTQAEAIEYAKEVAEMQQGSIRVHSLNGRIRKI